MARYDLQCGCFPFLSEQIPLKWVSSQLSLSSIQSYLSICQPMKLSTECHYVQFLTPTLFAFLLSGFDSESNRCESGSTSCLGPHATQDTMWDLPESCRPHLWQIQDGPHGFHHARTGYYRLTLTFVFYTSLAVHGMIFLCSSTVRRDMYRGSEMIHNLRILFKYHHFWYHHL